MRWNTFPSVECLFPAITAFWTLPCCPWDTRSQDTSLTHGDLAISNDQGLKRKKNGNKECLQQIRNVCIFAMLPRSHYHHDHVCSQAQLCTLVLVGMEGTVLGLPGEFWVDVIQQA